MEDHCEQLLGQYIPRRSNIEDPFYRDFCNKYKEIGIESRKRELLFKFVSEVSRRVCEGWFIVFDTLTVSDEHYHRLFAGDEISDEVRDYTRRVQYACTGKQSCPEQCQYFNGYGRRRQVWSFAYSCHLDVEKFAGLC